MYKLTRQSTYDNPYVGCLFNFDKEKKKKRTLSPKKEEGGKKEKKVTGAMPSLALGGPVMTK